MSVILNNIEPVVLENIPLDWSDCPAQFHKYVKFKEQNWLDVDYRAVYILDEMAKYLTHDYKSIYFDFKVYDLKEGDCGCPLPDWHIDVTPNPNHPTKECRHLIYTTEIGTEFLTGYNAKTEATDFRELLSDIREYEEYGIKTLQVPPNVISLYHRSNVHRAPVMTKDCKRVMIRLTETDVF